MGNCSSQIKCGHDLNRQIKRWMNIYLDLIYLMTYFIILKNIHMKMDIL